MAKLQLTKLLAALKVRTEKLRFVLKLRRALPDLIMSALNADTGHRAIRTQ